MKRIIILFICALTSWSTHAQNNMERGRQAYDRAVDWDRPSYYREALAPLQAAAKEGYGEACYLLGEMYRRGLGIEKNLTIALRMYSRAIEFGYEKGEAELGDMYFYGQGVATDNRKAYDLYRQGMEKGVPETACRVAMFYFFNDLYQLIGLDAPDYTEAHRLIMSNFDDAYRCKDGNVKQMTAMFCLDRNFITGPQKKRYYNKAPDAYEPNLAAELLYDSGYPKNMYKAILLMDEEGITQLTRYENFNDTYLFIFEAVKKTVRYKSLTDLQKGELFYIYAKHAMEGSDFSKDQEYFDTRMNFGYSAADALELSARYGYGPAQKILGGWYAQGKEELGIFKNLQKSREWYAKAKADGEEVPE